MSKRKKNLPVLVPVDFSPASANAVVWAAEMAACWKSTLVILHVVHDLGEAPGYYSVKGRKKQLQRMEDVAAEMLDGFHKEMVAKHPDLAAIKRATLKLVIGLPVNRILEVIKETDSQLVVMGSQGRTGLGHLLLGSKAEQIVRLSPVPVTIVKSSE